MYLVQVNPVWSWVLRNHSHLFNTFFPMCIVTIACRVGSMLVFWGKIIRGTWHRGIGRMAFGKVLGVLPLPGYGVYSHIWNIFFLASLLNTRKYLSFSFIFFFFFRFFSLSVFGGAGAPVVLVLGCQDAAVTLARMQFACSHRAAANCWGRGRKDEAGEPRLVPFSWLLACIEADKHKCLNFLYASVHFGWHICFGKQNACWKFAASADGASQDRGVD